MDIDILRDHVAANTDLTVGQDLFSYSMPGSVDEGVMMVMSQVGASVDHDAPGRYGNRFEVIVRSPDYEAGKTRAGELFSLLTINGRLAIGSGLVIENCLPRAKPLPFRRSESDLMEWQVIFEVRYFEL